MKYFIAAFICLATVSPLLAQQETYLTHFAFNKGMINSAFAGENGVSEVALFHHRQWVQLKDQTGLYRTYDLPPDSRFPTIIRPVTQGGLVSIPIGKCKDGDYNEYGGLLINSFTDNLGYEKNTHIKFGASFVVQLTHISQIRVGLDADMVTKSLQTELLRPLDPNDPLLPVGQNPGSTKTLFGTGLVYKSFGPKGFYAGISMSSWNRPEFEYSNQIGQTTKISAARHLYIISGFSYPSRYFRNTQTQITMLLRSSNAGNGWVLPQLETQYNWVYNKKFSFGTGIRGQAANLDALTAQLGFFPNLNSKKHNQKLRIGYSFDLTLQSLRQNSRNTHELQVNYTLFNDCVVRKIEHPRDLKFNRGSVIND
ncbi:MAG: PorP/SprF family type IX secretion system membrane protein [Bacteroidia bacterium]|nr:PorP/SprF family type IX secretion system membrane protein [Bacteroidia bacterium]